MCDAPVTVHLHLLEDARSELMPHEAHSSSVAGLTSHNVLRTARARACREGSSSPVSRHFSRARAYTERLLTVAPIADGFPPDLELLTEVGESACRSSKEMQALAPIINSEAHLHRVAFVHGFEVHLDLCQHVLSSPLLLTATEPERLPEDIVWVAACTSSALALLQSFLAISVVSLSQFRIGQDLVGAGHVEEFRLCLFRVVLVRICEESFGQRFQLRVARVKCSYGTACSVSGEQESRAARRHRGGRKKVKKFVSLVRNIPRK